MHVLVDDDLGRLVLRRVQPWHRMLACSRAGRLDRELAAGTSPEASADGTGPLYREASRADLGALAERAAYALTWDRLYRPR